MSESKALRKAAELTREKFAHFNEVMGYDKKGKDAPCTHEKPSQLDSTSALLLVLVFIVLMLVGAVHLLEVIIPHSYQ